MIVWGRRSGDVHTLGADERLLERGRCTDGR